MANVKKLDGVKKENITPTVSAPLIPLKSDSIIASAKKEDVPAVKKEEVKKDEVKVPTGPTLEDLALQQLPTVAELQAKTKASVSKNTESKVDVQKDETPKPDLIASARLEEIAAQEKLSQTRAASAEYKVASAQGPQALYHSNDQSSGPTSMYHPASTATQNLVNQQKELTQRGGVVTQYDRSDLQRQVGRDNAEALLEEKHRQIHGDKGLFEKYDRR